MKKYIDRLLSMQTAGMLLLIYGAAIGTATFIENDFGTQAAKAVVYNATWFNILMIFMAIVIVTNVIKSKLYKRKKFTIFIFHISFICILLGAGITRFISYEGMMHIREGKQSSTIMSDQTFVQTTIQTANTSVSEDESVLVTILNPRAYSSSIKAGDKKYKFKSQRFIPNARKVVREGESGGTPYMELVISDGVNRNSYMLQYPDRVNLGNQYLNFSDEFLEGAINVKIVDGALQLFSYEPITTMSMMGAKGDTIQPEQWYSFGAKTLYVTAGINLVLTNFYQHGIIDYVPLNSDKTQNMDALEVMVSNGQESEKVFLHGGKGYEGMTNVFELGDVQISMTYGSREIQLPFALQLKDFQLDRYPGSMSPSSYASEVILIDENEELIQPHRIYMNNVLNYKGFRFFQSSYDKDELGTILSVNHDYWGTLITYIGYFFMTLGMALSLFNKNSRFGALTRIIKRSGTAKTAVVAGLVMFASLMSPDLQAQHNHFDLENLKKVNKEQADKFGELLVQTTGGRVKPINSLASELLRKVSRKSKLHGMIPEQVLLGMATNQVQWQQVPMIKVKHSELKELLGIEGSHAAYLDFIDISGGTGYKLQKHVSEAYEKKPAQRSLFDKDVMAVDERLNICYMIYMGDFLKILPDPNDAYKSWYSPVDEIGPMNSEDSSFIANALPTYLDAIASNNMQTANTLVSGIAKYQQIKGAEIIPSETKASMEILYNRMEIFNNLSKLYGMLGVFMIILIIVGMFNTSKVIRYLIKALTVLVILGFVFQTGGLALRWYISGHAPWSNGYESMIYIGWVTMLAGILLAKKSDLTLAATTVLASIILMVAHLSWMDPEITPLVPVLKSYWLTIHVSIITASYGFLALGAILGFLNLILMVFKTKNNHLNIDTRITELSAINEKALIIGLYMLTVGTFLGGIWANESWGRYWGWDPKETWALASVIFYAFIIHMQYIPGIKSKFSFNFASLIGFFSILMTYFGVNYYLSGLHSYAKGDPVPVPTFVYYTVAIIFLVAIFAHFNNARFTKAKAEEK